MLNTGVMKFFGQRRLSHNAVAAVSLAYWFALARFLLRASVPIAVLDCVVWTAIQMFTLNRLARRRQKNP